MTRRLVATLLITIVVSACGQMGNLPSRETATARERQQAEEALVRWAAAVAAVGGQEAFVPVGELTGQIGDWEAEVGDNNKPALMAGMVFAAVELPSESPGEAEVRWDDGTTKQMQTISAEEALQDLRATAMAECPECRQLLVTAARLSTATVLTSRGPATAPTWEFTLQGTNVVATRIAVAVHDGVVVKPPPWDADNPPIGISIESARGSADGRELTVAFIGAPDPGDKACGADYTAEAVESETAIVVIVIPHPNGFGGACRAVGAPRTATALLAEPVGERAVLEVKEGLPVPVELEP